MKKNIFKPHIKYQKGKGRYTCDNLRLWGLMPVNAPYGFGWGPTPKAAYEAWLKDAQSLA